MKSLYAVDVKRTFDRYAYLDAPGALPGQDYFTRLYAQFDEALDVILSETELQQLFTHLSEEWLKQDDNAEYSVDHEIT